MHSEQNICVLGCFNTFLAEPSIIRNQTTCIIGGDLLIVRACDSTNHDLSNNVLISNKIKNFVVQVLVLREKRFNISSTYVICMKESQL